MCTAQNFNTIKSCIAIKPGEMSNKRVFFTVGIKLLDLEAYISI